MKSEGRKKSEIRRRVRSLAAPKAAARLRVSFRNSGLGTETQSCVEDFDAFALTVGHSPCLASLPLSGIPKGRTGKVHEQSFSYESKHVIGRPGCSVESSEHPGRRRPAGSPKVLAAMAWAAGLWGGAPGRAAPDLERDQPREMEGEDSRLGTSTPLVWGERVFVLTAVPIGTNKIQQFVVLCCDRKTGKTVWQKVAREEAPHEGHHADHGYASASPITDGQYLLAYSVRVVSTATTWTETGNGRKALAR